MESYYPAFFDSATGASYIRLVKLDSDRAFLLWIDGNDDLKCRVVGFNGNNAVLGDSTTLTTNSTNADACLVATDKVAVIFKDETSSNEIYVQAFTISGFTITAGTAQQINGSANNSAAKGNTAICSPQADVIVAFYRRVDGGTNEAFLRAATLSGTVFTFGTEVTESATLLTRLGICALGNNKVLYFYNDASADGFVSVRTLSGTTLSAAGSAVAIYTSTSIANTQGLALTYVEDDKALLYLTNDNGECLYLITASGTTATLSYEQQVRQFLYSSQTRSVDLARIDASNIVIVYKETLVTHRYYLARVGISGNSIISISEGEFFSEDSGDNGGWGDIGLTFLGTQKGLVAFDNTTQSKGQLVPIADPPLQTFSAKRNITQGLQVSWKKDFRSTIRLFTIGVSIIGGNDIIAPTEQIDSQWNKYLFYDESAYITALEWEQSLRMPEGGISIGMAAGRLENTTGRFTPRYMGGTSELFTAILPRRPFILNAGFEDQGIEETYPQFVGLFDKQPQVDLRERMLTWRGKDFVDFLQNRFVDDESMFTGQRSDQLIEDILESQGFTTAQYDLDVGINTINFAIFRRGEKFADIIDRIARAEYAQFYQDEEGILRFENRQHWDSAPHNHVAWELMTSQVLDAEAPDTDHIINVVEVKSDVRAKQPEQTIFRLATFNSVELQTGLNEIFIDFEDPVLSLTTPTFSSTTSYFKANTRSDATGANVSTSVSVARVDRFSTSAKLIFNNTYATKIFLTELVVTGRSAPIRKNIYYRSQDDSSVTAYEERTYSVENDFIQDEYWAASFANMILLDYAEPENLQRVTIRAIPELRLGDLVSWQGRHWRVFSKSSTLNTSAGFVQEVMLLKRDITTYFRVGISTIGGTDLIAP